MIAPAVIAMGSMLSRALRRAPQGGIYSMVVFHEAHHFDCVVVWLVAGSPVRITRCRVIFHSRAVK